MPKKLRTRLLSRRRVLAGAAGLTAAAILPRPSLADWKPTENVRIIVPAAAGGSTDVMGRLLAAHLQSAWGQTAVVENRSGGGGTIGTAEVVRSKADGHTILIGNPGPNAIAYSIFKNLTYKPDQLQPVSNMIRIPNIVSAHPKTGIKSVAELIAYLKANPDKLSYASSGVGQSPHLTGAWFLQLTGLKMTHIPFRGAGPALQAALAGDIQVLFDNLYPSLPQVQNGTLNGLCVTTTERSELAPNLPTMRECAPELANFDVSSWFSVFLPKGVPAPVLDALNLQVKAMLERDDIRKQITAMGARADYGTPQQFADFVDAETKKFAGIIQKEGLQMDVQ
ncbi:tripartite tricarboxylate transporter substrate binding protein [Bradyrhizobium sp. WYCCWR 13023]|uniref:Tripartite tricarboxylate transporter substrate binding protein n=1 Tax=Bradyrhizobium zhengyangense TaxID=2911009 RepID=A0A9X1RFT6_9BRAD|nr:tripartite tricarboxylate transporter substrate binding protein [Bradyrhizobium zhengyangense]MCG2639980.1 tripartite tricarboxylate transporter substrate binding protein [Bradyrhizobium zhengyangense]MCG2672659.1 tripartite tricarboxylate transporter substrate binding protein [Bradyrhizobium zhengyangense]